MRISYPILICLCLVTQSPGWSKPTSSPAPKPAPGNQTKKEAAAGPALPTKPIWLIRNSWKHRLGLPYNFRAMQSPLSVPEKPSSNASKYILGKISTIGLREIAASGSGQPSVSNMQSIKAKYDKFKIIDLDLRQEPHGYINSELPISWYSGENQLNRNKSLQEIQDGETWLLQETSKRSPITTFNLTLPDNASQKIGTKPHKIEVQSVLSEEQLCQKLGMRYIRLPIADYQAPGAAQVDNFINVFNKLGQRDWLHIHCSAGDMRTTTFLAMLDMLRNADKVSFNDILSRQYLIGGSDLSRDVLKPSWRIPYAKQNYQFLKNFYNYCKSQKATKFAKSWSAWKKEQRL